MNNKPVNSQKSLQKNIHQKKNNLRPLIFTFFGTFAVFFFVFTFLLPIFTPKVDIPALTDEHSMNSVNSNDFKGRLDPRLSDIEQQENQTPPKLKMEMATPGSMSQSQENQESAETQSDISASQEESNPDEVPEPVDQSEESYNNNIKITSVPQKKIASLYQNTNNNITGGRTSSSAKSTSNASQASTQKAYIAPVIPPRPQSTPPPLPEEAKPIAMAKVILGSYATPMQARLVSDTLIEMDLNVAPFIKEKNGRYILQVGSFSDSARAEGLVQELRSKSFEAKIVYE